MGQYARMIRRAAVYTIAFEHTRRRAKSDVVVCVLTRWFNLVDIETGS